ncbi:hypothetical protein [Bacillus tropicus]|uniref:hypothetical protein n=1 Tax=Bacillus tropicus TaxID=2026188 RepID=UPI0035DAA318
MAKYYGYCYNENGKFTEMIPIDEKPIYEKQTFEREEQKEVVTEEKLCELHQNGEEGKQECPDCVMRSVELVTVKVPYEEDVIVGYEPDLPPNCTLEVCPWLAYEPVFKEGKWVKTVEPKPEEPQPEKPSELEKIKQQLADIQKELEDIKNQKPPTIDETEVPIAFAAPIQDTPNYEHEINKIKQVIPNLGEQIVDLNNRIADLENKEQV